MNSYSGNDTMNEELEQTYNMYCSKAQNSIDQEKFDQAIDFFKEALKIKPNQIQVMGELCFCYCQANRLEEMLNLARKALLIAQKRVSKDNIGRFYFYIAQYYKITEQYEEANKYFTLAIANKPYFVSNYIDSAYCLIKLGKYIEAISKYEQVKIIDSEYAEENDIQKMIKDTEEISKSKSPRRQYILKGQDYEKNGQFKLANAEFLKALELAPKDDFVPLLLLFMNEAKINENFNRIIIIGKKLLSVLNTRENRKESYVLFENICLGIHKSFKALNDDKNAEIYLRLSQSYSHVNNAKKSIESNDFEKAIDEYKKALELNNNDYLIIDGLIDVSFKLNQLDEALDYAVIGLKVAKLKNDAESAAKYLFDIGTRYDISGYNKAVEFFENAFNTATKIDSKLKYCKEFALTLGVKNNFPKAIEYLKKCQEYINEGVSDIYDIQSYIIKLEEMQDKDSDLNKSIVHFNIGSKYFNEMKFSQAAEEMQSALSYIPQDLDAMDCLNRCLFKLKRYDECIKVCHEGYLICCRDRDFRYYDMFCYNLGNCYYNIKDNETALKYYQLALNIKPYDIDYLYFVAACYRNMGFYEKAIEYFQIANKIAPEDEEIQKQLTICQSQLNH